MTSLLQRACPGVIARLVANDLPVNRRGPCRTALFSAGVFAMLVQCKAGPAPQRLWTLAFESHFPILVCYCLDSRADWKPAKHTPHVPCFHPSMLLPLTRMTYLTIDFRGPFRLKTVGRG